MEKQSVFTKKDIRQCLGMVILTIFFSLRGGEFREAAIITFRHVAAYLVYGFALVFIFIGIIKKINMSERFFEKKPGKAQLVKWAIGVSAFLAIYQMIYELLLALVG